MDVYCFCVLLSVSFFLPCLFDIKQHPSQVTESETMPSGVGIPLPLHFQTIFHNATAVGNENGGALVCLKYIDRPKIHVTCYWFSHRC